MKTTNWRAISALNAVSTLAQLGQFGVGFLVLPIWLAARGMGAIELGFYGAVGWAGMLAGLLITPKLLTNFTSKYVVFFGLFASTLGFLLIPQLSWPLWCLPAFLVGFGMGLRWIANETWLYRISPQAIVGQVVGFHEALISLAVIIGPLLVVWFSTAGNRVVFLGAALSLAAALPLLFLQPNELLKQRRSLANCDAYPLILASPLRAKVCRRNSIRAFFQVEKVILLGISLAIVGGITDGAFTALFPIFGLGRGFAETQIASLLAVIGLGGLLMQYPIGWLSDKIGFLKVSTYAAIVTMLTACAMAFVAMPYLLLNCFAFIFGGFFASFLTLGIIAAASEAAPDKMARNMSKVSIAFTVSSIVGALLAGFAAAGMGSDALLWLVALVSGLLAIIFLRQLMVTKKTL